MIEFQIHTAETNRDISMAKLVLINLLAGSKDCDEIEYWYNLNKLVLSISMTKLFKNQIIPSSTIT